MDSVPSSALRADMASAMRKVCENHAPLLVTRQGGDPVVLLSLADYQALEETAYLLRSPANAKRLESSIRTLETGKGKERDLRA